MLGDRSHRVCFMHVLVSIVNCDSETVLYLTIAYEAERDSDITMTYVPAHLYYMLFELIKVSQRFSSSLCSKSVGIKVTTLTVFHMHTQYTHTVTEPSSAGCSSASFILCSLQTCVSSCDKLKCFISLLMSSYQVFQGHPLCSISTTSIIIPHH